MQAILRGFANILRFSGRDRRGQFWPYAGVVLVLSFAGMSVGLPMAMQPIFAEAARMAEEHPEAVSIQQSPTSYQVEYAPGSGFMPDFSGFILVLGVAAVLTVVLLAAAVTRRLHDRGLPGFIGLIPAVLLGSGLFGMSRLMATMGQSEPDLSLFGLMMLNNMLYIASLITLIVLLALPGKPQPNHYGPPPSD